VYLTSPPERRTRFFKKLSTFQLITSGSDTPDFEAKFEKSRSHT